MWGLCSAWLLPVHAGMASLFQLCSGVTSCPCTPARSAPDPSRWCCCSRSGRAGAGELIQLKRAFFPGWFPGMSQCRRSRPTVLPPSSHPASTAPVPRRGWGDRAVRSSPAPGSWADFGQNHSNCRTLWADVSLQVLGPHGISA